MSQLEFNGSKAQSWITPSLMTATMMEQLGIDLRPAGERQTLFTERFDALRVAIDATIAKNERATAWQRGGVDQVNAFLKERQFDIKLEDSNDPDGLAAAATIDLQLRWQKIGQPYVVRRPPQWDHLFPHQMAAGAVLTNADFVSNGKVDAALIAVADRPLTCVIFACPEEHYAGTQDDLDALSLLALQAADADLRAFFKHHEYEGVHFPKIVSDLKPDLNWLKGIGIGKGYSLTQALQQLKLRLDHEGAIVKEAAAGFASRGMPRHLYINGPMAVSLVARVPNRAPVVLLTGLYGPDCWVSA